MIKLMIESPITIHTKPITYFKMKKKLNIYVITKTLSKVANPFLRDNRKKSNVVKAI